MYKFLKKILFFLFPIFIVWGGLEYFYRTVESNYSYKHRTITKKYTEIEILVLGDSHAFFGINPQYMDSKTYNFSNISQSLYFDKLLIKKHIKELKNLKSVIITIGYYSLSQQDNTKEDRWRKYFYQNQMQLDVPIISVFDPKGYSLALTRRFNKSMTLINKYFEEGTIIGCDTNGWGNYYKISSDKDLDEIALKTAKKHEDFSIDFSHNISRLQSIIDICKSNNTKVYLVDMPVYKGYIENLSSDKLAKITTTCEALDQKNENTFYINLREDPRLQKSDLYDADHLNHKGAEKFTKIIYDYIVNHKISL